MTKKPFRSISDDPEVQSRYEQLCKDGTHPNMAEIIASRCPPGTRGTERALFAGLHQNQNLGATSDAHRKTKLRLARRNGVDTTGKAYFPELARPGVPNDPLAWCGDISDYARAVRVNGKSCPALGIKAPMYTPDPKPAPRLNPRIVKKMVAEEVGRMPKDKRGGANRAAIADRIIEKHGARSE